MSHDLESIPVLRLNIILNIKYFYKHFFILSGHWASSWGRRTCDDCFNRQPSGQSAKIDAASGKDQITQPVEWRATQDEDICWNAVESQFTRLGQVWTQRSNQHQGVGYTNTDTTPPKPVDNTERRGANEEPPQTQFPRRTSRVPQVEEALSYDLRTLPLGLGGRVVGSQACDRGHTTTLSTSLRFTDLDTSHGICPG